MILNMIFNITDDRDDNGVIRLHDRMTTYCSCSSVRFEGVSLKVSLDSDENTLKVTRVGHGEQSMTLDDIFLAVSDYVKKCRDQNIYLERANRREYCRFLETIDDSGNKNVFIETSREETDNPTDRRLIFRCDQHEVIAELNCATMDFFDYGATQRIFGLWVCNYPMHSRVCYSAQDDQQTILEIGRWRREFSKNHSRSITPWF